MLMLGVNDTVINQCNPSTSGDAALAPAPVPDAWCELAFTQDLLIYSQMAELTELPVPCDSLCLTHLF